MSEDDPTKQSPPKYPNALGALSGIDWAATARDMEAVREALAKGLLGQAIPGQPNVAESAGAASGTSEATAEGRELQPQIAGSKPKPRRNKSGKNLLHGADRVVKFYKPTEAELDRLGEISKDESKARQALGFCVGLVVNVLVGMIFATGMSPTSKGVAFGIGICASFAAYKFWKDARTKERDGQSALERLKADHDFTNI